MAETATEYAELLSQAVDLAEGMNERTIAQAAEVKKSFVDRQEEMIFRCWVNSITGSDNNDGSEDAPFKTMQAALDVSPAGGSCRVKLQQDYHFTESLQVDGKHLIVESDSLERKLTFAGRTLTVGGVDYRALHGFQFVGANPTVTLLDVEVVIPALEGEFAAQAHRTNGNGVFRAYIETTLPIVRMQLTKIQRPENPHCPLMDIPQLSVLSVTSVTETGNSMLGHWVRSATDTAGTPKADVNNVSTNLATL